MMVVIFVVFYALLIMPQQRRQKKWQAMLAQVKPGDKVVTSGGLTGAVIQSRTMPLSSASPPTTLRLKLHVPPSSP